jgi:hypothetical protein
MTYSEILAAIRQLSVGEQLLLMEELARSLREELALPGWAGTSSQPVQGLLAPEDAMTTEPNLLGGYASYVESKE